MVKFDREIDVDQITEEINDARRRDYASMDETCEAILHDDQDFFEVRADTAVQSPKHHYLINGAAETWYQS